ncbi:DUF1127 domain-containing protein [Methylobacterium soli]|uniref:DUF1127 domain-containing protein n=1 Tax=Methylobacterium soli TaxID=553447 RepID=A0A6L3SVY6_9HYPH|nr:DUF1127 domain-containing protein [Methylobacterium soli]
MLKSIICFLQIWWRDQRICRELQTLDCRSLEDIGLEPYQVPRRRHSL